MLQIHLYHCLFHPLRNNAVREMKGF